MKRSKHPFQQDNDFIVTWIIGAIFIFCLAIFFAIFINSYVEAAYTVSGWL